MHTLALCHGRCSWPLSLTATLYPSTGRHVLRRFGTFGALVKVTSDDETAVGCSSGARFG
ncbi:unnamed protein product [Penicillium camemberti]|uniref:Str. FM013 n=1 Tax=Penicillium camemberti (strain FM 013) TaxID=1429867 RepID=A0A0G4NSQ4_PENC3|nr:unnamed protein product [Penicillium camemberti]